MVYGLERSVDECLIRRGELLLVLVSLKDMGDELRSKNEGKVGRLFKLTGRYAEFLIVVRYLFSMPYRQLETSSWRLIGFSWLRRRVLMLNLSLYEGLL